MENEDLKKEVQSFSDSKDCIEFVQLVNDGSDKAGELLIHADVPEVKIEWVTNPDFNIDTTQCTVAISEGVGVLPIKWRAKDEHGAYAPINMLFEGGVKILTGESSKYVPIILSHGKVDQDKLRKKMMTRAENATDPKASSISFLPAIANMSADRGATMYMRLTNVAFAIMDYSGFKPSNNVDLSTFEDVVSDPMTTFKFLWKSNTPATNGFEAPLTAYCEEIAGGVVATITWETEDPTPPAPGDLVYSSSNLPTGNVSKAGGTYTFTFTGSYAGAVHVRALFNNTVLAIGAEATNKQPQIGIPENTGATTRNIIFEYKRADGDWTALPASTNRIQDATNGGGTGDGSVIPGSLVPSGDIPDEGSKYYCNFTGTYRGSIIMRAMSGTTELVRSTGKVEGTLNVQVPGITGIKQRTVAFEYSIDGGATWVFIESKLQTLETLAVNAFQPATDVPSAGGVYTTSVTGTYSKKINFVAVADGIVIARGSTSVPGNVQLTIPAYTGNNTRLITFQYARSNGDWKIMEVKRQYGN